MTSMLLCPRCSFELDKSCSKCFAKKSVCSRCKEDACNREGCTSAFCSTCCLQSNKNLPMASCSDCEKGFCKMHLVVCKYANNPSKRHCFGYVCLKCQGNDKAWCFDACAKCSSKVCKSCMVWCSAKDCNEGLCAECSFSCKVCSAPLCEKHHHRKGVATTHACETEMIGMLFERVRIKEFTFRRRLPTLMKTSSCEIIWNNNNKDKKSNTKTKTTSPPVFYYRDGEDIVFRIPMIKRLLIQCLQENDHNKDETIFSSIVLNSKGSFGHFYKELVARFRSLEDLFISMLQMQVFGYILEDEEESESEEEETKVETPLLFPFEKKPLLK